MLYQHRFSDDRPCELPNGKIVCVGRNYAEHARELNNPIPKQPLLFIKPSTALAALDQPLAIPRDRGECHHELELALLIGQPLSEARAEETLAAIAGYGLALDLTLRELQSQLKEKGQPWERAKAFDGACPVSAFVPAAAVGDWKALRLQLQRNGALQQDGQCRDMLFPIEALLADISQSFTLLPGDIVLTGTPAGVGPLNPGDRLRCELDGLLTVETTVG
ncbi:MULTISPECIES: fumarylacetoacetate hydrolase family protein [Spongiibacter]|uniref:fumarylacetoacetate hydrolase family protein n=1 Tax=Spongiibacter TaxID=630749 RepID=UPI000C6ADE35|nr:MULTISPECIES: fumarylacetoacetate hydrolase family protein [Spongiibacter]MAY39214.1 isomerase/hydrolase [Spongiibacter sp.]MBI57541.1 isomerase/hydrolase [Spongiibacter sp.]MBU70907.1 isomerase/hydrolase [Spongiibacter sp.]|tara:strand:- start:1093 stop:1755 length:663 start_codon:yes stop_codon:yes gene_type:complete